MLRIMKVILVVLTTHSALQAAAAAQTSTAPAPQASIGVNGGLVAASQGNGAAMGLRIAFGLTDRLSVEADGSYLGRGGSDSLGANASLLVNLAAGHRGTVPYVAVGAGLYRAAFDLDHDRFFGRLADQFPAGTPMIPISGMSADCHQERRDLHGRRDLNWPRVPLLMSWRWALPAVGGART